MVHCNLPRIHGRALCTYYGEPTADKLPGLKPGRSIEEAPTLPLTRRIRDLAQLPEDRKRAILKVLDDLIRANT